MPVYGRFLINDKPRYAEVEGDTVYFVDDLFDGAARSGEKMPLAGLKILAPVMPKKLFCHRLKLR